MKLLIADDHTLFRDALSYYLQRERGEYEIISVADVYEAEAYLAELNGTKKAIDIVLLDLLMPGMNGLQGLERIVSLYPDVPVLLMSGIASIEDVKQAIRIGARGYFPKTHSCEALIKGVDLILSGENYIPVSLETGKIIESSKITPVSNDVEVGDHQDIHDRWVQFRETAMRDRNLGVQSDVEHPVISLTKREKDVLTYLVKGERNKDIADALGIKTVTVKLHVRSICRKFDVQNRTQAAVKANELNIIGG